MKPLFLCFLLLVASVPTLAQDLSLRNLLQLRKMPVEKVDRKLSRKGWTFVSDNKPAAGFLGKAVWAYNPNETGDSAPAWCILYYSESSPSRILYNVYVGNPVEKMHRKLRTRKLMLIAEGNTLERVQQLEYYADFADQNHVFRLMKYTGYGFSGIKVFEQSDYEKAKTNGRL